MSRYNGSQVFYQHLCSQMKIIKNIIDTVVPGSSSEVEEITIHCEIEENDTHQKVDHPVTIKKHLLRIIPNKYGRVQKRSCQVCDQLIKKAATTIFKCVGCPDSPAMCLGCFRRRHRF